MVVIRFLQKLIASFQHVATKGKSTKKRARRVAARPPAKCGTCGQPVQHPTDPSEYEVSASCGHETVPPNRY